VLTTQPQLDSIFGAGAAHSRGLRIYTTDPASGEAQDNLERIREFENTQSRNGAMLVIEPPRARSGP
jgi:hypothetical protein